MIRRDAGRAKLQQIALIPRINREWAVPIRTTTCQNLVFSRRCSKPLNISHGNLRNYVSRKDAKIAKANSTAILSSWRSLRLGERTGLGCGRRPRWVICAIRGGESVSRRFPRLRSGQAVSRMSPSAMLCGLCGEQSQERWVETTLRAVAWPSISVHPRC